MARKTECIAMLLAGGQGSRLGILTKNMAKPAVPYGGKYRIIDFPLSNCVNSGIYTVGVLTQYQPLELNDYIGNGQPWDLDRENGGVHILSPYQQIEGTEWYKNTANAIYQNINFIDRYSPEYVLILSGDHIYKMDYSKMLASTTTARYPSLKRSRSIRAATRLPWAYTYSPGASFAAICSRTRQTPPPATTSVMILSPRCMKRASAFSPISSTATGRMSAR